ncbi:MAG: UDP-glucose--hexose-1-phosphate uridylyltransferase [Bacteroidia bacterium]|nr:UDP-glucose--hexose-1-phosphate uridylyltransferase [Bacteroidia bacterium]
MNTVFDYKEHPHKRYNLLTGEWILVSPHRNKRPWQGKIETAVNDERPAYDENCYLCPGNARADGSINPVYKHAHTFVNDFSALLHTTPEGQLQTEGLLIAKSEQGICKVISFSPCHHLTLAEMETEELKQVVDVWQLQFKELSGIEYVRYIQIFENKGDIMGCSNPHPHGQVWASSSIPNEIEKETRQFENHYKLYGRSLLSDYIITEQKQQERIIDENNHFIVLVPFWATWPFETIIISKRHVKDMLQFTEEEKMALSKIMKNLLVRYDNLFQCSFPYSAGMHQRPVNDGKHNAWHWHMHFYPPLLRSAQVKKFMVGYEMLANAQRDITPEWAAQQLKSQSTIHYKKRNL